MGNPKSINEVGLDDLVEAGLSREAAAELERTLRESVARARRSGMPSPGLELDPREVWRELASAGALKPSHTHRVHQLVYYSVYSGWDASARGPPLYWFPSLRGRSDRRRSPVGYSWSPPPRHARSRSRSRDYYSPPAKRRYSRSASPQEKRHGREKSYSPRPSRERSYSRSPPINGSRSDRESPAQGKSRSRSRSPPLEDYAREPNGDGTPSQ